MITKTCEVCGVTFQVKPYRAKTARFCSFQCSGKWHAQERLANIPKPWAAKNLDGHRHKSPTKFTTDRVKGEGSINWVEGDEYTCVGCGNTFYVKPWLVRQNGEPQYCSADCYCKHRPSGENSPLWVGGITTYRGKGWLKARAAAVERDNGTCQDCGKVVGVSIPVHHIAPFRQFATATEANRLGNLVCLCQSCHMKREYSESLPPLLAYVQSRS